jgi:hypothetical protein
MYEVAQSQDAIGWMEFLHGKISTKMRKMQQGHCLLTNTSLNREDRMVKLTQHLTLTMALQKFYSPPLHKGLPLTKDRTGDTKGGGEIDAHKQPQRSKRKPLLIGNCSVTIGRINCNTQHLLGTSCQGCTSVGNVGGPPG